DGSYTFGNLPNGGTYTVSVDRSGRLDLMALTATPNNTPEVESFNTVTLNGANVTNQDFGFYEAIDYDDLPDNNYNTLVASEGAGHVVGDLWLGASVNTESNGWSDPLAASDTSDNGITFASQSWTPGATVDLTATVTGDDGYLVGWFDWDGNGSFGTGEMVIFGNVSSGDNPLQVTVPADASNPNNYIYIRFRLYDRTSLTSISPTGLADNGEVEGYRRDFYPTAVTLSRFWSTLGSSSVILHWETATELDNHGFHIERAESPTGPRIRLNRELIPSYAPGSLSGATYEFVDNVVAPHTTYYYWLITVDTHMRTDTYGPLSQRLGTGTYLFFLPVVNR
ncbi:MAG TPA: GEVED domain-containing protein, partial [Anaerolineae bacterium]|nr:GEVED domain-containing protein [Anaerolineae bacterium]